MNPEIIIHTRPTTFLELWEAHRQGHRWTMSTFKGHLQWINHWVKNMGNLPLVEITPAHVHAYLSFLADKYAPKSQESAFKTLSGMFRWGKAQGFCENVFDGASKPRVPKCDHSVYSDEELARLFNYASPKLRAAIVLAYAAGLRKAEITNMRWAQVDWNRKEIVITPRKDPWPWTPKTYECRRVPMNEDLTLNLNQIRPSGSPFVFLDEELYKKRVSDYRTGIISGHLKDYLWDFRAQWTWLRAKTGLSHKTFHDLRATAITQWCLDNGALTAMIWAGHNNLATTQAYISKSKAAGQNRPNANTISGATIGATGFAPAASGPPNQRSTKLSYAPNNYSI